MTEYLFMRLNSSPTGPLIEWLLFNERERIGASSNPQTPETVQSRLPEADGLRKTIAFVPGEDILLSEVKLPKKQEKHLGKVLPFLVEDQLADEIGDMHFALSPQIAPEKYALASVHNAQVDQWLDAFERAGIELDYMIPEMLAVPYAANSWSIVLESNRAILRQGIYSGISVEQASFKPYLNAAINSAGAAPQITIYRAPNQIPGELLNSLQQTYKTEAVTNGVLDLMATEYFARPNNINLLQGKYQAKHKKVAQNSEWRRLAMIVLAFVVLQFAFNIAQGAYFSYQNARLDKKISSLYQSLFPEDTRIVNPVQQMKTHLNVGADSSAAGNFFSLFGRTSYQLQQQAKTSIKIKNISYTEENGKIVMTLEAANIADINNFVQNLKSAKLFASADSLNNEKNLVSGQVTISNSEGGK